MTPKGRLHWSEYELGGEPRAMLEVESRATYRKLGLLLTFRYGFVRWGVYVPPLLDEAVYPSFRRWGLCIDVGWDNWSDFYFLACDDRSIAFLRRFVKKHCEGAIAG